MVTSCAGFSADVDAALLFVRRVLDGQEPVPAETRTLDITGHAETLAADRGLLGAVERVAALGRKANVQVAMRIPADDEGLRLCGMPTLAQFGGSAVLRANCRWSVQ